LYDDDPTERLGAIDDERIRLIFTCCHPALAMETRVALFVTVCEALVRPGRRESGTAAWGAQLVLGVMCSRQTVTRSGRHAKAALIP
jgi:RNA polymerase sigma-70 factor, ECF subfamily